MPLFLTYRRGCLYAKIKTKKKADKKNLICLLTCVKDLCKKAPYLMIRIKS
nr:MAG TPA: hypothetical protein [Caudoviricetes sp.]